jgi:hypothetical protein
MSASHTDLLASPASPEVVAGLLPGTIEGPPGWWEGFGAGLRVWCGPLHGWRDFGELLGQPSAVEGPPVLGIMLHKGRLQGGLSWNLGAAKMPRRVSKGSRR